MSLKMFVIILRWNMDEIDMLPKYIKSVYSIIMSFSEEFGREAEILGKAYVVPYYIEAVRPTTTLLKFL